jgi:two-component system chemotaxis sensor kinase CheA
MDPALLAIFRESSLDQLSRAEARILDLENADQATAAQAVEAVFRGVHTIKGDAATLHFSGISRHCHEMESVLHRLRGGELAPSSGLVSALLAAFDALGQAIRLAPEEPGPSEELALAALAPWRDSTGEAPCSPQGHPQSQTQESSAPDSLELSYNVSAAHMDLLLGRMGEIMLANSRLAALARREKNWQYLGLSGDLERQLTGLGQSILEMRLLPFQAVTAKYRRMVRDLAAEAGKDIDFTVTGEMTELDKSLIEKLNTPLVHLLRNAVRHGIEPQGTRLMAGKPATGHISVDARQEGGEIVITVADDGGGIDARAVFDKAVLAGFVTPDASPTLKEMAGLVFLPGVSTSGEVDAVSGRGVGLDAVRSSITELGGEVELDTAPGKGAVFTLRAPLSMSLLECLRVRVGDEFYFLPMECVEQCVEQPASPGGENATAPSRATACTCAPGGHLLPCLNLDVLFGLTRPGRAVRHLVVARHGGARFGAMVDEVLGLSQVMVKSLDKKLLEQDAFLGAALGEDGAMCLIVDPRFLARQAQGASPEPTER